MMDWPKRDMITRAWYLRSGKTIKTGLKPGTE